MATKARTRANTGAATERWNPIAVISGTTALETPLRSSPTGNFGVGVLRFNLPGASQSNLNSSERHLVTLQLSRPVAVFGRIAGRRMNHNSPRRSVGILPCEVDGDAEIQGPVDGVILRVSPECLGLASAQLGRHGAKLMPRSHGYDHALFNLGQALEAEARAGHPNGPLYWSSLADAVIRHLAEHHLTAPAMKPHEVMDSRALARLDNHIRTNLETALDLTTLAGVAGCDRFRFARVFRASTGVTPHRYVTRFRLEKARDLIATGKPILAEVALATGFCDQSHLSRWFLRVYGMTPGGRVRKNIQDREAGQLEKVVA